ncbi:MAG: hypothetical protein K9M07_01015 [Simkaniaceae bacterium]|nr:hypothetical protein [Simkaniaceae bacterium]
MDMTLLAKIFGPTLILFGLFKIFFRDSLEKITKNFAGAHGAYWMESVVSMIIGLAIINAPQVVWYGGLGALLPLYGWICFIKGVLLLFLGDALQSLWGNMVNRIMIGILRFAFGWAFVCLGYFG